MPHPNNTKYIPGDHWCVCDVCGFEYRASEMEERWDGRLVCKEDWEPRHPQEMVRAKHDDTRAKGHIREEPADEFVTVSGATSGTVPSGTFDNSL